MMVPRVVPVADHGLLVEFASRVSPEATAAVLGFDRLVTAADLVGVLEVQPALVNVLVEFDPLVTDHAVLTPLMRDLAAAAAAMEETSATTSTTRATTTAVRSVEVCYHTSLAPDLASVAAATAMSVEAVVATHLAAEYVVAMYGFAPGYAYLSGVAPSIQLPRKAAPVRDVPAGSVLIAGPQCLVSTLTMPTGWSNIGRSATEILPANEDDRFLFDVGDRVRFQQIDLTAFELAVADRAAGTPR